MTTTASASLPTIAEMAHAELITCTAPKCRMQFFLVPAREFPTLCLDHADDASRDAHGWTLSNSTD